MSVDLIVYLRRSTMPTPRQWQQAIRDVGFPIKLDANFDVDTFRGFLPCQFRGADAGFEYFSAVIGERESADVGAPQGADFAVTLVTHSDLRELVCSLMAASALCQASGGLLLDPQSGQSYAAEQALAWVKEQLSDLETT